MASLHVPTTYHINVLTCCKLCNHCDFFNEMDNFMNCVPLVFNKLFVESLVETFHCILHSPQHMWFFHLFKRNAQFFDGMF